MNIDTIIKNWCAACGMPEPSAGECEALNTAIQAVGGNKSPGWKLLPAEPTSKQVCLMTGAMLGQPKGMADNRDPDWLTTVGRVLTAYQVAYDAAPAAPAGEVIYRWQALDFSGYCYGSNPPEDLPARCNLTPFYRQPDAYRAALHEISATGNLTATDQQFARHLKQIARDALAAAPHAPAQEAPDTPAQHQGMTIAGNGAAELGKLMQPKPSGSWNGPCSF